MGIGVLKGFGRLATRWNAEERVLINVRDFLICVLSLDLSRLKLGGVDVQ